MEREAPNRRAFILESLRDLEAALSERGARLVIRNGDPATVLQTLAEETAALSIYSGISHLPETQKKDAAIQELLQSKGIRFIQDRNSHIFAPGDVMTGAGTAYTVFTPFRKAALAKLETRIAPAAIPSRIPSLPRAEDLDSVPFEALPIGGAESPLRQRGGLMEAKRMWLEFCAKSISHYKDRRDMLADAGGTSHLAPHLSQGTISVRTLVRDVLELQQREEKPTEGIATYISELMWREFYALILQHFPYVEAGAYQRKLDALRWSTNERHFEAWKQGKTGVPIVDAAMRELRETGWMHNRARMIVASFLTKDLQLSWQWGEQHFAQWLTDYDLAQNNGGWQWAASTGTDAQPYYRIFNPYLQSRKFDPSGAYIRRYVPELAQLDDSSIHEPHLVAPILLAGCGITLGRSYPLPIVDHKKERDRALAMYKAVG